MLNRDANFTIIDAFKDINGQGPKYFFSGIVPRVFWISIGGSIFLGVYDKASKLLGEK
jgi:solute carrier family 25 S-adenosylmethionine transporter 26